MSSHAIAMFEKKILLLLSDDNPIQAHPNSWGLIGGQSEENETPMETLLREFEEEASIRPKSIHFLVKIPNRTNLFLVELSETEAKNIQLGNEGVALRFFSLSEFKELPLYHRITHQFPQYLPQLIDCFH